MKKSKLIIHCLALVIAIGGAFAFKVNNTLPGDLYYVNDSQDCVRAPCEINNNSLNPCQLSLFSDNGCNTPYPDQAWTTGGGR